MKEKTIQNLKLGRLLVAILMVVNAFLLLLKKEGFLGWALPDQNLIMSILVAAFVFLLGLQYKLEHKPTTMAHFLMLFAVVMLIMSILGFVT